MPPPPPPPLPKKKKIDKGLPAKGFCIFFVMVGKTLIANQCFVECIIFFLPIMTYCNSFPNSVRCLIALVFLTSAKKWRYIRSNDG